LCTEIEYIGGPQAGEPCVTKVFKSGGVFEDRFFTDDVLAISRAQEIITAFNVSALVNKTIFVNQARVWEATQPDAEGRYEKLLVEPMIEGDYVKFNSSTGFATAGYDVMQAVSHFSFDFSDGQELLCDLQGGRYETCYVITDPVILPRAGKYGLTDLGAKGRLVPYNCHCPSLQRHHLTRVGLRSGLTLTPLALTQHTAAERFSVPTHRVPGQPEPARDSPPHNVGVCA